MACRCGLLLLLLTFLVGLLSVVSATRCNSCPWRGCSHSRANFGVCTRGYYVRYSYTVPYRRTIVRSTEYTRRCGSWWRRRRRCTETRYWQVYETGYRREYSRRFQCASDQCCSGWHVTQYSPRICEPSCSGSCLNGGTCIDTNMCSCLVQWTGRNCENHNVPEDCICHNGGTCVYPNVCECTSSWTGPRCETPICTGGCQNGGLCVKPNTCNCTSGWTGANCETDIDECTSNASGCDHNCTNARGWYFCTCQDGFMLSTDSHYCTDVNECNSTDKGGCDHICFNTPGSYNCSCNEGFRMLGENNTCIEMQADPAISAAILGSSGVAAVSGVTVSVIVAGLVVCVLVAVVVKLRCSLCKKEGKDSTQDTEPTPENVGGFELTTNPAYGEISYVKDDKSQNGGPHPVWDDDGGNVYVSTDGEPPAYENLNVLY